MRWSVTQLTKEGGETVGTFRKKPRIEACTCKEDLAGKGGEAEVKRCASDWKRDGVVQRVNTWRPQDPMQWQGEGKETVSKQTEEAGGVGRQHGEQQNQYSIAAFVPVLVESTMSGRRSSHQLRENVKFKYSNTKENPVTVDEDEDDDDFINPPKRTTEVIEVLSSGQFVRVEDGEESEEKSGNTEKDEDDSCYEFQDEEGFLAVLGISYQKILYEKHNLERVLTKGIEKYPNIEALKAWKIKMNREFKLEEMDEETERFENDDVQDEETETEEEIPDHDEGKGKELVVIQEPEHLNHISPENENINNENEEGYITPIAIRVENLESTHSLSSTQFFEQPGVLEEVEDMLLKATAKSSEEKTKMNEEAEKVEEKQENIEKNQEM
ncbi:hypothetical protein L1887_31730 [Cichorium endivia]|nr:hypothetical protein L1887_31730 [Cichorium endivia]